MSDEILNQIHTKVEKISEDVSDIKIIAAKHDENLKEHMRRTSALENLYDHLDTDKIGPLQADMNQLKGIYKFVIFLSVLATIALTIVEWIKH